MPTTDPTPNEQYCARVGEARDRIQADIMPLVWQELAYQLEAMAHAEAYDEQLVADALSTLRDEIDPLAGLAAESESDTMAEAVQQARELHGHTETVAEQRPTRLGDE